MITPAQCRAARGLLKWTQEDLAERSGCGSLTIFKFEAGKTSPHNATMKALKDAFEKAGVVFIAAGESSEPTDGPGVRLGKPDS